MPYFVVDYDGESVTIDEYSDEDDFNKAHKSTCDAGFYDPSSTPMGPSQYVCLGCGPVVIKGEVIVPIMSGASYRVK